MGASIRKLLLLISVLCVVQITSLSYADEPSEPGDAKTQDQPEGGAENNYDSIWEAWRGSTLDVVNAPPVTFQDLLDQRPLALFFWNPPVGEGPRPGLDVPSWYWETQAGRILFLCVAFNRPENSNATDTFPESSVIQFYETEGEAKTFKGFRLRFSYEVDQPFASFETFPAGNTDYLGNRYLLVRWSNNSSYYLAAFGMSDGKVRPVWCDANSGGIEFADLDNDGDREVIVPHTKHPAEADIYTELQGRFPLVAKIPWEERLQERELPDAPISEH